MNVSLTAGYEGISQTCFENVFLKYYAANFGVFFLRTDHGDKRHIVQTVDKNPLKLQKRSIYLTLQNYVVK